MDGNDAKRNQERTEESEGRRRQAQAGFTLVEIMVVVVIIGMLASLVGVSVIRQLEKAKRQNAVAQIKNFQTALELYYMDNSRYPTTDQGLMALVQPAAGAALKNFPKEGYISEVPLDPWNFEYIYFCCPGVHGGSGPSIESYAADGLDGGAEENTDIESWNLSGD